MAKGDKVMQKVTWNTNANATLAKCTDESGWSESQCGNVRGAAEFEGSSEGEERSGDVYGGVGSAVGVWTLGLALSLAPLDSFLVSGS